MNQITDRLKDAINQTTELLQMHINIQQNEQNESNNISNKIIHLISLLTTISIESNKLKNVYNDRHSKLSNCLIDMKTLVQSQKRKISSLESKPYCIHKAINTDNNVELSHMKENLAIGLNLEHKNTVNSKEIENLYTTVRRLKNQVDDQNLIISSLRKKLHQSCSLLKAQQVLIDNCSYSNNSTSYTNSMNSYNVKEIETPSIVIYREDFEPKRPPLPSTTSTCIRSNTGPSIEYYSYHDDDVVVVDSKKIVYNDMHDDVENVETSNYVIDTIKYDSDYYSNKEKDADLNIDNYSETNTSYYHHHVFEELSDHSQDREDVNNTNLDKSFENDYLYYSQSLITSTNTTINDGFIDTDKVDLNNVSSWNINSVNDSFVLVQDFYDMRFSE